MLIQNTSICWQIFENKKNLIQQLHNGNSILTTHKDKEEAIHNHYLQHIGSHHPRTCSLNLSDLGWQPKQLQHLENTFTEEEIKSVVMEAPKEKAPGPDGYIGLFFSSCWEIIKEDTMKAVHQFYDMNQQGFHFLNQALVVIPEKDDPQKITDYMPISLLHSFAKLISKVLANRLGPELHHLISINQTAFIQKRSIQDNFMYVKEVIRDLYKKKIPARFIKLDISKAFDTVNWAYLLHIMEYIGFGQR
jgi:hypothetical protein